MEIERKEKPEIKSMQCPKCGGAIPVPNVPVLFIPCPECGDRWFEAVKPVMVSVDANNVVHFKEA